MVSLEGQMATRFSRRVSFRATCARRGCRLEKNRIGPGLPAAEMYLFRQNFRAVERRPTCVIYKAQAFNCYTGRLTQLLIKNLLPLTQLRFLVLPVARRVAMSFSRRVSLRDADVVGGSRLEKTRKNHTQGVA